MDKHWPEAKAKVEPIAFRVLNTVCLLCITSKLEPTKQQLEMVRDELIEIESPSAPA